MAQKSIPWPRGVAADSLVGYTAQEWSGIWAAMQQAGGVIKIAPNLRTIATFSNVGVFYSVANQFVVTTAVNRVNVDTGAALVCGHAFYNDALIGAGGDITNPGAGLARYDRVVLRCNFSAADYVPGFASAALFTVPSYTARITIVHGADGGGVPALTQDQTLATYWDIPLYQYIITEGGGIGVITALTDQREWADAETKQVFVPCVGTSLAIITTIGWQCTDAELNQCLGYWHVPGDFISGKSASVLVYAAGAGNIYSDQDFHWGTLTEAYNAHSVTTGYQAIAVLATVNTEIQSQSILSAAPDDWFRFEWTRDATDPLDTINGTVWMIGWLVDYLGWR